MIYEIKQLTGSEIYLVKGNAALHSPKEGTCKLDPDGLASPVVHSG